MSTMTVRTLAIVGMHVYLGRSNVYFPTTDVSSPSRRVVVDLRPDADLFDGYSKLFPQTIDSELWNTVLLPVLKGVGGLSPTLDSLSALEALLKEKAIETGYLLLE